MIEKRTPDECQNLTILNPLDKFWFRLCRDLSIHRHGVIACIRLADRRVYRLELTGEAIDILTP